MHQAFDKKTLARSLKPVILVVFVCLLVYLWGNHRKVDIDLQFSIELKEPVQPKTATLTFYDADHEVAREMTIAITPTINTANISTSLRPGNYTIRGMITSTEGRDYLVEQTVTVPDDHATMVVYLRD